MWYIEENVRSILKEFNELKPRIVFEYLYTAEIKRQRPAKLDAVVEVYRTIKLEYDEIVTQYRTGE
jgi:hypothetical protein